MTQPYTRPGRHVNPQRINRVPRAVLRRWLAATCNDPVTDAEVKAAMVKCGMCAATDNMEFVPHSDGGRWCIAHNHTTHDIDSLPIT